MVKYTGSAVGGSRQSSFTSNLARLLGLRSINNGADHDLIRIWLWNPDLLSYAVTINDKGERGSLELCSFSSTKGGDSIRITSQRAGLQPLSGWAAFADTLYKYRISQMPGYDEKLRKAGGLTTMIYVQFEVADKEGYRYFEYLEPYYYRFIDSNSSCIDRFLFFLNKELGQQVYFSYTDSLDPRPAMQCP
jgi:hypothetical protein